MSQFVHRLPLIVAFSYLRAEIPHRIVLPDDWDFWAFIAVTETVLEVGTLFRSNATRARTVSRRAFGNHDAQGSPTNQVNAYEMRTFIFFGFILICFELKVSSRHPNFLNGVDPADTTKFADAYHWQTLYEAEPNMGGTDRRDIGAKNDADVARS
jgi:hypothetical protein